MATMNKSSVLGNDLVPEDMAVAFPADEALPQDAEWCVVQVDGEWRRIRLHAYDELYSVPGLYEKVIYEILGCRSPRVVRNLLDEHLRDAKAKTNLRVLDLGAGNGIMAEEMRELGAEFVVGADIIPEAAMAAERDRPTAYDAYHIADFTDLGDEDRKKLEGYKLDCLTCVAALGFGDIPPKAFATAYNFIAPNGWIAFNIKESFLSDRDSSGFSKLVGFMEDEGVYVVDRKKRYEHRKSTDGDPIPYVALVGRKQRDLTDADLERLGVAD